MTENTLFLSSEHDKDVYDSLKCFSETKDVEAVYLLPINKAWYAVYVFCPNLIWNYNKLLNYADEVVKAHPDKLIQFSYLQDVTESIFKSDRKTTIRVY